jgi:hypothetical protein
VVVVVPPAPNPLEPVVPGDPDEVGAVPVEPEPPPPGTVEVEVDVEDVVGVVVVVGENTIVVVVGGGTEVVVVVVLTGVALGTNTSPCEVWRTTPVPVSVD